MNAIFKGLRPLDYVLAVLATAAGVFLMYENITAGGHGSPHPQSTTTAAMLPFFLPVTVPILWRRRNILAVVVVTAVALAVHVVLFGWVTRCGAGLPLALVLVFLGAQTYERAKAWLAAGLSALLAFAVVVVDATTGPNAIGLVLPVMLIIFGIGWAVRHRAVLNRELKARDAELRRLRDERAALVITDDRAQLSEQLDGLLQERLAQLTTAAESADGLAPEQAKALLESIETDSRRTLDDMRLPLPRHRRRRHDHWRTAVLRSGRRRRSHALVPGPDPVAAGHHDHTIASWCPAAGCHFQREELVPLSPAAWKTPMAAQRPGRIGVGVGVEPQSAGGGAASAVALDAELSALRAQVAGLRAENARLLRLLGLMPQQALPRAAWLATASPPWRPDGRAFLQVVCHER